MPNELKSLLQDVADRVGVKWLALPFVIETGFLRVKVIVDDTAYGLMSAHGDQFDMAALSNHGLSVDLEERTRRVLECVSPQREAAGVLLRNGELVRLTGVAPFAQSTELHLTGERTSYFSSLGTNVTFDGCGEAAKPLDPENRWPLADDWSDALSASVLANPIAIHLMLYNDKELLYVRRGRVGQNAGKLNSTVNGAVEYSLDRDPADPRAVDLGAAVCREADEELGVDLKTDLKHLKWLGLAVTLDTCEPFMIGVARIEMTRAQLAECARSAADHTEIENRLGRFASSERGREKAIHSIPWRWDTETREVSLGPLGSFTVPWRLSRPAMARSFREKVLDPDWTSSGAASLALALAHLMPEEQAASALRNALGV